MSAVWRRGESWMILAKAGVMALATWFIYAPAFHGGLFWDDPAEITGNAELHSWSGLGKIWFAPGTPDYYPVKTTLQWVQWHLWGDSVTGYHLTNAGLHLLSAILLWRLFGKLGIRFAWTGALLFAVHPLAVESVAWISELKNVLSLTFLLLAMLAWLNYDDARERALMGGWSGSSRDADSILNSGGAESVSGRAAPPGAGAPMPSRSPRSPCKNWYLVSFLMFGLAMLSKSSVVMFPVILLLYGWWTRLGSAKPRQELGRIGWRYLAATAPFFAVSLGLGLVSVWFQHFVAIRDIIVPQGGALSRLAVAGMAVFFYFGKILWPGDLLPIYPRWHVDPPAVWQFWPWAVGAILAVWLFSQLEVERLVSRRFSIGNSGGPEKRLETSRSTICPADAGQQCPFRSILFGVGFFVINLIPVMGFVKMSFLRISWVADHFVYLPMIGVIGLAAAGLGWIEDLVTSVFAEQSGGGQASEPCMGMAWRRGTRPGDRVYTFRPVFGARTRRWMGIALAGLLGALALLSREHAKIFGSETEAWEYTIQRNPDAWLAHNNLSNFYLSKRDIGAALGQVQAAIRLKPDFAEAHNNYGNILLQLGRTDEAKKEFEQSIALRRGYAEPINGLGNYYLDTNQPEQALACYERALKMRPDYSDSRNNLAAALERLGRVNDAITQYRQVIREKPEFAPAHYNLGIALDKTGKVQEAMEQYRAAFRLDPYLIQARNNLGIALYGMNRLPEAIEQYEAALTVNPGFFEAQVNLANALLATHDYGGAILHYHEALQERPDFASGHNSLGIALVDIGHRAEARSEFEEALRLDPHFADPRHNLDLLDAGR